MKILCVLLPHFPLRCEVLRQPELDGHHVAITLSEGSQKQVLDYSPELRDLQQGMELQGALARHDDIKIIHADIPYYWHSFNRILDALENISPVVEGKELGVIYLGMDGMHFIYPNDSDFVRAARKAIPESFVTQVGIGHSKFLAYLAARQSHKDGGFQVLSGDVSSFLKDLSCDVLPISVRSRKKLHEFGIHTLGQITALPAGPVQSQFGTEGLRIWKLAGGQDDTPFYPRSLEEATEENTILTWVTVSMDALLSIVESLLVKALAKKELHGKGITCITVWTRGQDTRHWEKVVKLKEPAMNVKSALPRIKHYLENYPQPGPVEQVGIKITRFGHSIGRQKSIFSEVRAKDHLLEDIKQLELRMNAPQLYQVKEIEPWSRIPERRHALVPLNQ